MLRLDCGLALRLIGCDRFAALALSTVFAVDAPGRAIILENFLTSKCQFFPRIPHVEARVPCFRLGQPDLMPLKPA